MPATTTRRSRTTSLSLLSFLKNDDEDLLGDLLNAPGRTLATLAARVAELDAATPDMDFATADVLGCGDAWTATDDQGDLDELAEALASNTKELDRARKAARRRLAAAEFLINTKI